MPKHEPIKHEDYSKLPGPLFELLRLYEAETQPFRKVHRLIDAFEWVIKWHTVLYVSDLLREAAISEKMKVLFAKGLEKPSLGIWFSFFRESMRSVREHTFPVEWERLSDIEEKHHITSFRNLYAHGATPSDEDCEADCAKFHPLLLQIIGSRLFIGPELFAADDEGAWLLKGAARTRAVIKLEKERACVTIGEKTLFLWPLALFANDTTKKQKGWNFFYFNAIKNDRDLEQLNYENSLIRKNRDGLGPFYDVFPIRDWNRVSGIELDIFKAHIEALTEYYKGRLDERHTIREFCLNGKGTFMVWGLPGIGKSSLIAQVFREIRAGINPEGHLSDTKYPPIIEYFIRRGLITAKKEHFLRHVCQKLDHIYRLGGIPIGDTAGEMRENLIKRLNAIESVPGFSEFVLFVDGLDEGFEIAEYLLESRKSMKLIILSRKPDEVRKWSLTFDRENFRELTLGPLASNDIRALLAEVTDRYQDNFNEEYLQAVRERSEGNPLYLKMLSNMICEADGELVKITDLPKGVKKIFMEAFGRITSGPEKHVNASLLFLLCVSESSLSKEAVAEAIEITPTAAGHAIDACREILMEDSGRPGSGEFQLFHESLREWLLEESATECEDMKRRLADLCCSWRSLRDIGGKPGPLKKYALSYAAAHLYGLGDHERLWKLLNDEEYRRRQIDETGQFGASNSAILKGIEMFAGRKGAVPEDDARLAWLTLRAGELAWEAQSDIRTTLKFFNERPFDDPSRIADALQRLETLNEEGFFRAAMLLLWMEADRQSELPHEKRRQEFILTVAEAIDKKIPHGSRTVDWSVHISPELMALIALKLSSMFPVVDLSGIFSMTENIDAFYESFPQCSVISGIAVPDSIVEKLKVHLIKLKSESAREELLKKCGTDLLASIASKLDKEIESTKEREIRNLALILNAVRDGDFTLAQNLAVKSISILASIPAFFVSLEIVSTKDYDDNSVKAEDRVNEKIGRLKKNKELVEKRDVKSGERFLIESLGLLWLEIISGRSDNEEVLQNNLSKIILAIDEEFEGKPITGELKNKIDPYFMLSLYIGLGSAKEIYRKQCAFEKFRGLFEYYPENTSFDDKVIKTSNELKSSISNDHLGSFVSFYNKHAENSPNSIFLKYITGDSAQAISNYNEAGKTLPLIADIINFKKATALSDNCQFDEACETCAKIKEEPLFTDSIGKLATDIARKGDDKTVIQEFENISGDRQLVKEISVIFKYDKKNYIFLSDIAVEFAKKNYLKELYEIITSIADEGMKAKTLARAALVFHECGRKEMVELLIEDSIDAAEKAQKKDTKDAALCSISISLSIMGNFSDSLAIARNITSPEEFAEALAALAFETAKSGKFREASEFCRMISNETRRSEAVFQIINSIKSLSENTERAKIMDEIKSESQRSRLLTRLACSFSSAGEREKGYNLMTETLIFDKNEKFLNLAALTAMAQASANKGYAWQVNKIIESIQRFSGPDSFELIRALAKTEKTSKLPGLIKSIAREVIKKSKYIDQAEIKTKFEETLYSTAAELVAAGRYEDTIAILKYLNDGDIAGEMRSVCLREAAISIAVGTAKNISIALHFMAEVYESSDECEITREAMRECIGQIARSGFFNEAFELSGRLDDIRDKFDALSTIGKAAIEKGKYDQAIKACSLIVGKEKVCDDISNFIEKNADSIYSDENSFLASFFADAALVFAKAGMTADADRAIDISENYSRKISDITVRDDTFAYIAGKYFAAGYSRRTEETILNIKSAGMQARAFWTIFMNGVISDKYTIDIMITRVDHELPNIFQKIISSLDKNESDVSIEYLKAILRIKPLGSIKEAISINKNISFANSVIAFSLALEGRISEAQKLYAKIEAVSEGLKGKGREDDFFYGLVCEIAGEGKIADMAILTAMISDAEKRSEAMAAISAGISKSGGLEAALVFAMNIRHPRSKAKAFIKALRQNAIRGDIAGTVDKLKAGGNGNISGRAAAEIAPVLYEKGMTADAVQMAGNITSPACRRYAFSKFALTDALNGKFERLAEFIKNLSQKNIEEQKKGDIGQNSPANDQTSWRQKIALWKRSFGRMYDCIFDISETEYHKFEALRDIAFEAGRRPRCDELMPIFFLFASAASNIDEGHRRAIAFVELMSKDFAGVLPGYIRDFLCKGNYIALRSVFDIKENQPEEYNFFIKFISAFDVTNSTLLIEEFFGDLFERIANITEPEMRSAIYEEMIGEFADWLDKREDKKKLSKIMENIEKFAWTPAKKDGGIFRVSLVLAQNASICSALEFASLISDENIRNRAYAIIAKASHHEKDYRGLLSRCENIDGRLSKIKIIEAITRKISSEIDISEDDILRLANKLRNNDDKILFVNKLLFDLREKPKTMISFLKKLNFSKKILAEAIARFFEVIFIGGKGSIEDVRDCMKIFPFDKKIGYYASYSLVAYCLSAGRHETAAKVAELCPGLEIGYLKAYK